VINSLTANQNITGLSVPQNVGQ